MVISQCIFYEKLWMRVIHAYYSCSDMNPSLQNSTNLWILIPALYNKIYGKYNYLSFHLKHWLWQTVAQFKKINTFII